MFKKVPWSHLFGGLAVSGLFLQVCTCSQEKQPQYTPPIHTLIIKYGGSAVTDKGKFETLDHESLRISSVQLKAVHSEKLWAGIVVVHGAGSFGHFHAKMYGLKFGGAEDTESGDPGDDVSKPWQTGLALTRQSVLKLNKHVVDAHLSLGLPVATVSSFPSVITGYAHLSSKDAVSRPSINANGSYIIEAGALKEVATLLSVGIIPVLHGDVVLDRNQRCAILGGDHIIHWLCQNLASCSPIENTSTEPHRIRVVFLTDVAGVYDRAPRLPGAVLFERINVHSDGTTDLVAATETAEHDVTGGIEAKLQAAIGMAQLGKHVEVYIVKAGSDSALQALRGETPTVGTLIALQ